MIMFYIYNIWIGVGIVVDDDMRYKFII